MSFQDAVHELYLDISPARMLARESSDNGQIPSDRVRPSSNNLSDQEVIERIRNHRRYRYLWNGKLKEAGHDDRSRADLDFVGFLVAMGCPAEQIDRVFRKSGMFRAKWDEVHRRDGGEKTYGQMTIEYALRNTTRRG